MLLLNWISCPKGFVTWLALIFCGLMDLTVSYKIMNETGAMKYLERFGYASEEDMSSGMTMEESKPMLMAFQKMCHINMTGQLDKKTMEMMNAKRCGNLDMIKVPLNESNRLKRYAIHESGSKWRTREVSYKIVQYSAKMKEHLKNEDVLKAIEQAFNLWSAVTNLDFFHKPQAHKADIELSFTTRDHPQDSFPFDGPGTTLAHAFAPGPDLGGDVHFEDEEDWRLNSPKGSDVLYVAVHEIGHALGLSHSDVRGSIMGAFYGGYRPQLQLHPDDIEGIQRIYGKRETKSVKDPVRHHPRPHVPSTTQRPTFPTSTRRTFLPPPPPPRVTPIPHHGSHGSELFTSKPFIPTREKSGRWERPDLCVDSKIDAITTMDSGETYVFKGEYVFAIDGLGQGVKSGWPNHINTVFPGLEGNIDAATPRGNGNGKTYFFKGKKYWRFSGTSMDRGYPKEMLHQFVGIPAFVESVFVWRGLFYFTKGDKYFTFDPRSKPHVDPKYPLPIEFWGLPSSIHRLDAAFVAPNNATYLFKDKVYYKLDSTFKVAEADPPYPRSSATYWFGCNSNRQKIQSRQQRTFSYYENPQDISLDDKDYY